MKRLMRVVIAAVLVACVAPSFAGFRTFGDYDCGQWFKAPQAKTWLLGYLTGMNGALADNDFDPLAQLNSPEQAFMWMDNYCKANPLKRVSDGGDELYKALQEQSPTSATAK